jgi:hypothetical protein
VHDSQNQRNSFWLRTSPDCRALSLSAKDITVAAMARAYASLMAGRVNKFATGLLSAMAVICSAALAILFFPAVTHAAPVEFTSAASTAAFDPHFWLFFALLCGAAFSALAALATWRSHE